MPLDHHIDEARNLVVARVTGTIRASEFLAHMEEVEQDERLRPGHRAFLDLSEAVATAEFDGEFVRRAADVARRFDARTGEARVAVLAPADVVFGLARMYALLVDSLRREVRVFREGANALAWLCDEPNEGDSTHLTRA